MSVPHVTGKAVAIIYWVTVSTVFFVHSFHPDATTAHTNGLCAARTAVILHASGFTLTVANGLHALDRREV